MTTQNIALSLKYKGLVQESGSTANGNQQRPLKHFGKGTEACGVEVNGTDDDECYLANQLPNLVIYSQFDSIRHN